MANSMFMGASEFPRATFVGVIWQQGDEASGGFDTTVIDLASTGAQVGDYALIFYTSVNSTGGGYPYISGGDGGWGQDNYTWTPSYGAQNSTFHKKLTANDLAGPITLSHSGGYAIMLTAVYRGAQSAVRRTLTYEDDGDSTHTSTAYAPAYNGIGMVGFIANRDNNAAAGSNAISASVSGGTVVERKEQVQGSPGEWFRVAEIDALGKNDYPSGVPVVWSLVVSTGYGQVSQLYELRA